MQPFSQIPVWAAITLTEVSWSKASREEACCPVTNRVLRRGGHRPKIPTVLDCPQFGCAVGRTMDFRTIQNLGRRVEMPLGHLPTNMRRGDCLMTVVRPRPMYIQLNYGSPYFCLGSLRCLLLAYSSALYWQHLFLYSHRSVVVQSCRIL